MVVGSILVALCLLVLGWTSEFVGIFMSEGPKVGLYFMNLCNCLQGGGADGVVESECDDCSCGFEHLCGGFCH